MLQTFVAIGGAALGTIGVLGALMGDGPAAPWLLQLFALWCVLTPYWWYVEHRWLGSSGAEVPVEADRHQLHSFAVWLGFTLAMGTLILRRGA